MDLAAGVDSARARPGNLLRRLDVFLTGAIATQALAAVSGILLARSLSVDDYALFTIVGIAMGAISILTKGGAQLGFTALLGRSWPDMHRASSLLQALQSTRSVLSIVMLPLILMCTALLLLRNGADWVQTGLLLVALTAFWWADFKTRIIDQILTFAQQTSRLQLLDTAIAMLRLVLILIALAASALSVFVATAIGTVAALLRIWPVARWVAQCLPARSYPARSDDLQTLRQTVLRQLPNDLYFVLQSQIAIVMLSILGSATLVAQFGAPGRIGQLLLPLQALVYAFYIPVFARAKHRHLQLLFGLVGTLAASGLALVAVTAIRPGALLWLLGPQYAHLTTEVVLLVAVETFALVANALWTLTASRGLNHYVWLQIPLGLAWCFLSPIALPLDTLTGAILFRLGFPVALLLATGVELYNAIRTGALVGDTP